VKVTEAIDIDASPDEVWALVGDTGAIAGWVPAIESSRMDGDIRHAEFAGGGGSARERIVEIDAPGRSYVYDYLDGPLPLERYRSRITVSGAGDGAHVDWVSELSAGSPEEEAALAAAIGAIYRDALAELARQTVSAAP
jgi:carbon monoxide dehydrogenase subunit G